MKAIKILALLLGLSVMQSQAMNLVHHCGPVKQEDRSNLLVALTNGVSKIELTGNGNVFIQQGEFESLVVETNEKLLPSVVTSIANGQISINVFESVAPNIYITLRNIDYIINSGNGDININGPIKTNELTIVNNSPNKIKLNSAINAEQLNIFCNNSGDVEIYGLV